MDAAAIIRGRKPSEVFTEFLADNPGSDRYGVAEAFAAAFPEVDSVCFQVIWNWRRPGMHDDKLDLSLSDLLSVAERHDSSFQNIPKAIAWRGWRTSDCAR
jgi:hypothetical protein